MSELKVINAYRLTTNTEDSDVYIHNDEFGCGGDLVECYLKYQARRFYSPPQVQAVLGDGKVVRVRKLHCVLVSQRQRKMRMDGKMAQALALHCREIQT